jgi:hypothetical protein
MSTVVATVSPNKQYFPAGTTPAGISISITGIAPQVIAAAPYTATFTNVPDGTYTAVAQAVDASGNPLGAALTSASFTVPTNGVAVDIPGGFSISVQ